MDIGFTFEGDSSEPEIVMLESHYEHMVLDINTMEGEIEYLKHIVDYLFECMEEIGLEPCICSECMRGYMEKNLGRN